MSSDVSSATALYFIDAALPDLASLLASLPINAEVHLINKTADGLDQMLAAIAGRTGFDAIHVLSHGDAARLDLGADAITAATLEARAADFAALGKSLNEEGDLLIYGCNVAHGDEGQAFIEKLAELTGADVAASTGLTGAAALGGDWELEESTGSIDTLVLNATDYQHSLSGIAVNGLSSLSYAEGDGVVLVDDDIAFVGGGDYKGGYLEFSLSGATATETLGLAAVDVASTVDGEISIVNTTVFRGIGGSRAEVIGSVDSVHNGQDGKALRINFSNAFENGDFQDGIEGSTAIPGWTTVLEQIRLNGTDQIAGQATPVDTTWPGQNGSIHDQVTWGGSEPKRKAYLSSDSSADGDLAIRLDTGSVSLSQGFGILRGPYVYSNGTVSLQVGDAVSFQWKALGAGDAYDAYGYIVDINTGKTINILDVTGTRANEETNWAKKSIAIGEGQEGVYRFVFVAGSYDASGGRAVGGGLLIDDVTVTQTSPPGPIGDDVITRIGQKVTYENAAKDFGEIERELTVAVEDGAGASGTATSTITLSEANNPPSFSGAAHLDSVAEDAAQLTLTGATVADLFDSLFVDADAEFDPKDSLAGIAISADQSLDSQGVWQFSLDGGATWQGIGAIPDGEALLLGLDAKLRFVPAANWNGTPGELKVHAVDDSQPITFSSTNDLKYFLLESAGGSSPVAAQSADLVTEIISVNDAPVLTVVSGAPLSYADTSAQDAFANISGTVTADDDHGGAPGEGDDAIVFGIQGGNVLDTTSTLTNSYGTLAIDTVTGAYTFTPNATAINGLGEGQSSQATFTVTASDGASVATKILTIDFSGANDAPVAGNNRGNATEASGAGNAVAGTPAVGNLLVGKDRDYDPDVGDMLTITAAKAGDVEIGEAVDGIFVLQGQYGTLTLNADGKYSYDIDETNLAVEQLFTGETLTDSFTYTLSDAAGLQTIGALAITVQGADDAPIIENKLSVDGFSVTEDTTAELSLSGLSVTDHDGGKEGDVFVLRLEVGSGTLRVGSAEGVTVSGTDTSTLMVSGGVRDVTAWLESSTVHYTTAPNGTAADSLTISYGASTDGPFTTAGDPAAITVTPVNDAPIVDLNGADQAGNDFTAVFRPAGDPIAVVDSDFLIRDVDQDRSNSMLQSAKVALTSGTLDNLFGTTYETLSSNYTGALVIAGNGTGESGLVGATELTFTGSASVAEYEAALRSVVYNNVNSSVTAGDRKVAISVTDDQGEVSAVSNGDSFAIATADNKIEVGQRIFINGVDSGRTVAAVEGGKYLVASGPLNGIAADTPLSFYAGGEKVADAVAQGPFVATTTIQTRWSPVIDLNGFAAGRNHTATFTEDTAGVAIATSTASITDKDGNLASVTVTLTNAKNGADEYLFLTDTQKAKLVANGIVMTGNGSGADGLVGAHSLTFTGNKDATTFQQFLRGVQYVNKAVTPDLAQREVVTSAIDSAGNDSIDATTYLNIIAVNDAPQGSDGSIVIAEDGSHTFGVADFGFSDTADVPANKLLTVTITTLPAAGELTLNGVAVTAGDVIDVAAIAEGKLVFTPAADGNGATYAEFTFQVQDDGGTANGGVDLDPTPNTISIEVTPVNDAPVLSGAGNDLVSITEQDIATAGQTVGELLAAVADVDSGANSSNNGTLSGIAVHGTANSGSGVGTWEYSLNSGTDWEAFGAVSEGHALLLPADALVRFVPDEANGNTASFSYYAWDQSVGEAGDLVDVSARGGSTAFSHEGASASIVVTDVNDAPVLDLTGADPVIFRPRGDEVAVVNAIKITDADHRDDKLDIITKATIAITDGDRDNDFDLFETLTAKDEVGGQAITSFTGSLGDLVITGNGTAAVTISGEGTWADYQAALQSVVYNNGNPNAYAGDREVTITITDGAVTSEGVLSTSVTTIVEVPWTPVIDLNGETPDGEADNGRDFTTTFTEKGIAVAVADPQATIVDQDGYIKTVTLTLRDEEGNAPPDGIFETLMMSGTQEAQLRAFGITTVMVDRYTIQFTLTDENVGKDATYFQLGIRSVLYHNHSDAPTEGTRKVLVSSEDLDGNTGVSATTFINVVAVNDAPRGGLIIAGDAEQGQTLTATQVMLSDPDGMGPLSYQWYADGEAIEGATGETLMLGQQHVGKVIKVQANWTDGLGNLESVSSDSSLAVRNVNDAPTVSGLPVGPQAVKVGTAAGLADLVIADVDGDILTVSLTATNGSIGGLADADPDTAGIQLAGSADAISSALAAATFTAAAAGSAAIEISIDDGSGTPVTASYDFTASVPPVPGPGPGPVPVPVAPGVIATPNTSTVTDGTGTQTTTTTGTIGGVPVTETVVTTPDGKSERTLVVAAGSGSGVDLPLLYESAAGSTYYTTARLPAGVGLTSVGARTPTATDAKADLLDLIRSTVTETDPGKRSMLTGGEGFLGTLGEDSTLWVNKVVLNSTASTAPAQPVVITGSASTAQANVEALVIDARALPAGTVIELQNVDFAVVLGDGIFVRGGNGSNVVYGGDGAQNIVLGSDDDVLYGGAGNDVIGSEAGNDRLFGNAGNDELFGGAGEDLLHGGADSDVATFEGSIDRYEITRDHGKTIVRSLDRLDDIDTLVNVEIIRFEDRDYNVQNELFHVQVASLYQQVLERQADLGGFQYWGYNHDQGMSIGGIAMSILYSAEYATLEGTEFLKLEQAEQLNLMYEHFLQREADAPGHAYWMDALESGMTIDQIADGFVNSIEMQGVYLQQEGWEFTL